MAEQIQKLSLIILGQEDILAAIAPGGDMLDATGKFHAHGTGHGIGLYQRRGSIAVRLGRVEFVFYEANSHQKLD